MHQKLEHTIAPVFDRDSRILILGSFPSNESRCQSFFYGHRQNRFWRVLALVFKCSVPESIEEKRAILLTHGIALWDVIASCDISGSSDSSIKNVVPNDLNVILSVSCIERIFVNGRTAEKYYNRYLKDKYEMEAVCLPSTSPANAAWSLERLVQEWSIIAN